MLYVGGVADQGQKSHGSVWLLATIVALLSPEKISGLGFRRVCIEFGPIFLQFRFFGSKNSLGGR